MSWLEEQDFYEMCQRYRHSTEFTDPTTVDAFEALKAHIRKQVQEQMSECCDETGRWYERQCE